jgi:hypothetical protein
MKTHVPGCQTLFLQGSANLSLIYPRFVIYIQNESRNFNLSFANF